VYVGCARRCGGNYQSGMEGYGLGVWLCATSRQFRSVKSDRLTAPEFVLGWVWILDREEN
jgi:hypothetical protein